MTDDDDQPATKWEIRSVREELGKKVAGMEHRLRDGIREDLGRALAIQREEFQAWARTFDDK